MPSRRAALRRLPIALLSVFAAFVSPAMSHGRVADPPAPRARTSDVRPLTSNVLAAEGWRGLPNAASTPSGSRVPAPTPKPSPGNTGSMSQPTPTAIMPLTPLHGDLAQPAPTLAPPRPVAPAPTSTRPPRPAAGWYDDAFTAAVRDLVNAERAKAGLGPLSIEPRLTASAAGYAKVLADNKWFAHVGPDGSTLVTRAEAAGFPFNVRLGEVLAWGTAGWPPASIVRAWMNSPSHRAEILNGVYTRAGASCYFTPAEDVTVHCVMDLAG